MPEVADLPERLQYIASLNAIVLNDTMWSRDADVLARTMHLNHGVGNTRLARLRDIALSLALASAGLLVLSLQLGASSTAAGFHGMTRFLSLAALLAYLVAIGWLARYVGGSRFVGLSGLAALGVYFRALDAEGLSLFVVVASALLFKDISAIDQKGSQRLVDLFDHLLEGAVFGAATGSVLSPIVFQIGGAAFDVIRNSDLFRLLADPRDVFPGLGTGLFLGAAIGLAAGYYLWRQRRRASKAVLLD